MSTFNHGYKYQIYPTEEQACQIDQLISFARFAYNWGIAKEKEIYEQHKQGLNKYQFYSYYSLDKLYRYERDNNPDMFWVKNFPLATARNALRNVTRGYERFFKHQNSAAPYFKSKKRCKKSFNTRKDTFNIKGDSIRFEGVDSRVSLGFDCGINAINEAINPVITKDRFGNYYVSFSLEEEKKNLDSPKTEGIGVDLGIRRTFTLSTGEMYIQPNDKLNKLEKKRRRQQRHVTRDRKRREAEAKRTKTKCEDIPISKRSIKRELDLAKTCRDIHNIKDTYYHTIAKQIVMRNPKYVCMETVSIMEIEKRQPNSSKYLVSTSFYDITCKIRNKCNQYNIPFIQAPKEFPSTQICSNCGNKKRMDGRHTYKCPVCGMIEDRDINAAINLKNYGILSLYSL